MTFDFNFFLGLFGFLATLIFGFLSIYLVKSKKYPGNITFIEEQTIGLFDSLVKNFPQISIQYNSKTIDQQIVLLKGFIINSGVIDIKSSMVEKNLSINLPKDFKWLNAKIVDSSQGDNSSLEIKEDNIIIFNLGLFRKNEFIRFEALVNVPVNKENDLSARQTFRDVLKFDHRIADTAKVEKRPLSLELPKSFTALLLIKLIPLLLYIVLFAYSLFSFKGEEMYMPELHYALKVDSSIIKVKAKPYKEDSLKLTTSDGVFYRNISINEFNSKFQNLEVRKWHSKSAIGNFFNKNYYWVFFLFLTGVILFQLKSLIAKVNEYKKIKKLRQTLKID